MNALARHVLILLFGAALLGFLCWGVTGLPAFGQFHGAYGELLNHVAVQERHVLNVVTSVIFDYRGFDTLGEEFILFASVTGVVLLMRHEQGGQSEQEEACEPHPMRRPSAGVLEPAATDLMRLATVAFVAAILTFGVYIVLTGHLSVGGGFQGGVILFGAWLLVLLAYSSETFHYFSNQSMLEWFEAGGAGGYIVAGCFGLLLGKAFLTNVLPLGLTGHLFSSGTILLINCAVGTEVAAGFVLILAEFVRPLEREARES
jgi:multicomponent Na+:H+ antiporter subunit B